MKDVPIITVDGPSGVGKGTLCFSLAKSLGWHLLDSGAIYRAFALFALENNVDLQEEQALVELIPKFKFESKAESNEVTLWLNDRDMTSEIRLESTGEKASIVAKYSMVRAGLLKFQYDYAKNPGLVADGRDMGTVVFPLADLKVFLIANQEERARRRYDQLLRMKKVVKIEEIFSEIEDRDERDKNRSASPLRPAKDAFVLDTSDLTAKNVFDIIWQEVLNKGLGCSE